MTINFRRVQSGERVDTYVNLDVLVLKVERMLPNVDANDGGVSEKRVLVGGGDDFKTLGCGVVSLYENKSRHSPLERRVDVPPNPNQSLGFRQSQC